MEDSDMPQYKSADHHMSKTVEWDPAKGGERVNDTILMSRGTSNAYLVTTSEGDVVINTGMPYQGVRTRKRFEELLERPLNVKKIILTQSHPDHLGGWEAFNGPGVETIVQRDFPQIQQERALLANHYGPRGLRVTAGLLPNPEHLKAWKAEANAEDFEKASTKFADSYSFTLGGRRFDLFATPAGETLDSLCVWLPDDKALFTGNLMGALYGALPHFYTLRGDRDRSIPRFLRDIAFLISLEPELLITGHDAPIKGKSVVKADLTKLQSASTYIHDETIKGMNALKPLSTLMKEIQLPPELQTAPGRGPVRWYVRAIWEEYTGWFRHEYTTELYPEPASSVWGDLAELAGGPTALTARAKAHLDKGLPVEALHLLDIALSVAPKDRAARETQIAALDELLTRTGGRHYDEVAWLEGKIKEAQAAIAAA
jgi:alkyl sulfatase BDS1-like metallo-beta-lactamase superfamily hydrolase